MNDIEDALFFKILNVCEEFLLVRCGCCYLSLAIIKALFKLLEQFFQLVFALHQTNARLHVQCIHSGATTTGEVRQLPQGAKRQGALGGGFGRRIVCFALQNSAEFLQRKKKLKNKQNDRNLVYLYSFRTMKVHL